MDQASAQNFWPSEPDHNLETEPHQRDNARAILAGFVKNGEPDRRSFISALASAAMYFALAYLSLALSRFDTALATVWLPSACAVALLLRMKLTNEVALYCGVFIASLGANALSGNGFVIALIFSVANLTNIALVTGLTRQLCGDDPDMSEISVLARFLWIGGLAGPLASATIAAASMAPLLPPQDLSDRASGWSDALENAVNWYLTDAMSMILIVPTVLLIADALATRAHIPKKILAEQAVLLAGSCAGVTLIFSQNAYPLLFLILPMTLLHTFRHGSLGTALHVAMVAIVASAMTWGGYGPITATSPSPSARLHLIQALIAANFLTGLPIAAILAGRDRLTEKLIEGRREISLLTNSMTDAVIKLDSHGICTYASPAVKDVLGRAPHDFLGLALHELTYEDARPRIREAITRLLSGQSERERLTYRRRDDDEAGVPVFIEAECAITLDPATGVREGVIISARDVTERVELELLLTRARQRAEKAANAKSDFLANMSHEIRTPMNAVLGFAELMLQSQLDPDQKRHMEMIVSSGRSMMLLLNDILDLSRIEAGQIAIDPAPNDIHATLEECMAIHRQSASKKGITLRLEHEENAPGGDDAARPTIITDGLRLRQIVLNLVGNAVKFTESGEVCVSYAARDGEVRVTVRDTGIGISASRLNSIFMPFTQAEPETAKRFGGTGLGLSISRQLANLLGGTIEVASTPGVGSTFSLTIPAARIEIEPVKPEPAPQIAPRPMLENARILMVEDNDVNRVLLAEMLEKCGQKIATAQDGNEAISMVIDSTLRGKPFDLVLMDVQMPDCDGYAATRAIREEGIDANTLPIIALTANAYPEDVAAAREAGMQAHLAKPIGFADLIRTLQRWLPTRIVETPMDVDAPTCPEKDVNASCDERPKQQKRALERTSAASLLERWLERRNATIEAVRKAIETGLLCEQKARRASDSEARKELIQMLHKLAGTAGSFGEPRLGEQAAALDRAMRDRAACEQCEEIAFRLMALADEPADAG